MKLILNSLLLFICSCQSVYDDISFRDSEASESWLRHSQKISSMSEQEFETTKRSLDKRLLNDNNWEDRIKLYMAHGLRPKSKEDLDRALKGIKLLQEENSYSDEISSLMSWLDFYMNHYQKLYHQHQLDQKELKSLHRKLKEFSRIEKQMRRRPR